jgi:hypothetical protein
MDYVSKPTSVGQGKAVSEFSLNEQKLKVGIPGVVTGVETMQVAAELCRREVGLP